MWPICWQECICCVEGNERIITWNDLHEKPLWKCLTLNDHNDRLFYAAVVFFFVVYDMKTLFTVSKTVNFNLIVKGPVVNIAQLQIFSVISMQNPYVYFRHLCTGIEKTISVEKLCAVASNCITLHMVMAICIYAKDTVKYLFGFVSVHKMCIYLKM